MVFGEQVEACHLLLLEFIHYLDVWLHSLEVLVSSPLHNHLGGDSETEGVHHECASGTVGGQQFPFRMHLFTARAALVEHEVYGSVELQHTPDVLEVGVHLLIADGRQGFLCPVVFRLLERLAALQDCAREVVEFDTETVGGLLGDDGDVAVLDVRQPQLGGIGVAKTREAAEAEHVPDGGETAVVFAEIEVKELCQFIPFEVDNLVGVERCSFELGAEVLEVLAFVVAFLRRPSQEPAQGRDVLFYGVVLEVFLDEVA